MKPKKKNLNNLKCETHYTRTVTGRKLVESIRGRNAIQTIGNIYPGFEMFGFTKGQFSMVELLEHLLGQTGPADVSIITWSAADADISKAFEFLENGSIRSIRFLVDYSFKNRKPQILGRIVEKFGMDAVRVTGVHAKSILIRNEEWNIVVRTSMNLNFNPRFENFEISESAPFAEFMQGIFDAIWADRDAAECLKSTHAADTKAFSAFGGAGETGPKNAEKIEVEPSAYSIFN